jgi:uncharacterized membrane protein YGL010W
MDNWYWIPIVGIIAWGAIGVTYGIFSHRKGALPDDLVQRLDAIDARLAAVEKTLNDIP